MSRTLHHNSVSLSRAVSQNSASLNRNSGSVRHHCEARPDARNSVRHETRLSARTCTCMIVVKRAVRHFGLVCLGLSLWVGTSDLPMYRRIGLPCIDCLAAGRKDTRLTHDRLAIHHCVSRAPPGVFSDKPQDYNHTGNDGRWTRDRLNVCSSAYTPVSPHTTPSPR